MAVIPGQGGRLGVASEEVLEQRNGAGCAVMQQEVAKVEVAVGSAHFAEVDDAGVPAMVVEPDVGGIEVAVRQVPSGDLTSSTVFPWSETVSPAARAAVSGSRSAFPTRGSSEAAGAGRFPR